MSCIYATKPKLALSLELPSISKDLHCLCKLIHWEDENASTYIKPMLFVLKEFNSKDTNNYSEV